MNIFKDKYSRYLYLTEKTIYSFPTSCESVELALLKQHLKLSPKQLLSDMAYIMYMHRGEEKLIKAIMALEV